MADPDANEHIIQKTFASIPAATSFDISFSFYLTSHSIPSGIDIEMICFTDNGDGCDSSGRDISMFVGNTGGTLHVNGQGSTPASANITIATGTWYSVVLHHDATAANCSIAVNGGAAQTFTCNANPVAEVYIGGQHSYNNAYTAVFGNLAF